MKNEWGKDYTSDQDGYFWQKMNLPECPTRKMEACSTCTYGCAKYHIMHSLIAQAEIPPKYQGKLQLKPQDDKELATFLQLEEFIQDIESHVKQGHGLYLYSDVKGNGKTSWAIKVMREYMESISNFNRTNLGECKAVYVNVPSFMSKTKASISDFDEDLGYLRTKIYNADLVIWDDIGKENSTDYSREVLYALINHHYENLNSQIFTSNYSPDQLAAEDKMGSAIMDRINEQCMPLEFTSQGKRVQNQWFHTK